MLNVFFFFFSSRRRHTRSYGDWSSDVCSSDLVLWWYYTLKGLVLHVPVPFYITPVLIYGSIVYLLIWRFRSGRGRWFALLLLFGIPIFGFLRDILGAVDQTSYTMWKSPLAGPLTVVMWLVMFYAGYLVFQRLAPPREENIVHTHDNTVSALEDSIIE